MAADGDELIVIKGVQRLTGLQHQDIGEVNHRVNGAHSGFGEENCLGGEVFGRVGVGQIKDGAGVARAEVRVGLDLEGEFLDRGEGGPFRFLEGETEDAGNFAGKTNQPEAVGAVGEGFVLNV